MTINTDAFFVTAAYTQYICNACYNQGFTVSSQKLAISAWLVVMLV